MDVDWSDLAVRMLSATPDERVALEFAACREAMRTPEMLEPLEMSRWRPDEHWTDGESRQIDQLRRLAETFPRSAFNYAAFRVSAEACSSAFARWRNGVHNLEAAEASKLTLVLWVYRTLYKLRDKLGPEIVDRMAAGVGDKLEQQWRCETVPLDGEHRAWAVRSTRRYDLLPRPWRFV